MGNLKLWCAGLAIGVCIVAQNVSASTQGSFQADGALFGHLANDDGKCASTATVNSFTFLQNKYPGIYDNKLVPAGQEAAVRDALHATMTAGPDRNDANADDGNAKDDSFPSAWWNTKTSYINSKAPGTTAFSGQFAASFFNAALHVNTYTTFGANSGVEDTAPTFDFLLGELKAGEDVEIAFQAFDPNIGPNGSWVDHALTLTGISWADANSNGGIDSGEASLTYIDPNNPNFAGNGGNGLRALDLHDTTQTFGTQHFDFLTFTWNNNPNNTPGVGNPAVADANIYLAFSESPMPLPSSFWAGLVLLAGVLGYKLRAERAAEHQ